MIVHQLRDAPPVDLAAALARFEEQFTYPLGPGRSFRISHGEDYPCFYRSMGEAACFAIEYDGRVLAVICTAIRRLVLPDGSSLPALYLGDLKIAVTARGGYSLMQLAQAMEPWVRPRATVGFGVVMDGTPVTPDRYTGKLGIPRFEVLARIVVLRLPTDDSVWHGQAAARSGLPVAMNLARPPRANRSEQRPARATQEMELFQELAAGSFVCPDSNPAERSEIDPLWFVHPTGAAVGRLEDTRRAKRLIADDGIEMRSAHLACFAYRGVADGVELLHAARRKAGSLGFPAMFVAVPAELAGQFIEGLACRDIVTAPATVYGAGVAPGGNWIINTSEI